MLGKPIEIYCAFRLWRGGAVHVAYMIYTADDRVPRVLEETWEYPPDCGEG